MSARGILDTGISILTSNTSRPTSSMPHQPPLSPPGLRMPRQLSFAAPGLMQASARAAFDTQQNQDRATAVVEQKPKALQAEQQQQPSSPIARLCGLKKPKGSCKPDHGRSQSLPLAAGPSTGLHPVQSPPAGTAGPSPTGQSAMARLQSAPVPTQPEPARQHSIMPNDLAEGGNHSQLLPAADEQPAIPVCPSGPSGATFATSPTSWTSQSNLSASTFGRTQSSASQISSASAGAALTPIDAGMHAC